MSHQGAICLHLFCRFALFKVALLSLCSASKLKLKQLSAVLMIASLWYAEVGVNCVVGGIAVVGQVLLSERRKLPELSELKVTNHMNREAIMQVLVPFPV